MKCLVVAGVAVWCGLAAKLPGLNLDSASNKLLLALGKLFYFFVLYWFIR